MKEIAHARFGELEVDLVEGDITALEVDAIVNPANNEWLMGGGVAAAIKLAGGIEIEEEARRQGKRPVGECIVTEAGKLKAQYVIHAAVMAMDFQTSAHLIRTAFRNTLTEAKQLKVKTLALPAFGTGTGGFPYPECAAIMLYELNRFSRKPHGLRKVVFALFGDEASQAFQEEINKYQEMKN